MGGNVENYYPNSARINDFNLDNSGNLFFVDSEGTIKELSNHWQSITTLGGVNSADFDTLTVTDQYIYIASTSGKALKLNKNGENINASDIGPAYQLLYYEPFIYSIQPTGIIR